MVFPNLPQGSQTDPKRFIAFRPLALLGFVFVGLLGSLTLRDRETRLAFSDIIVPLYGDYFAMSFRLRSSSCRSLGWIADEAYGSIGSTFPYSGRISQVNLLSAPRIAMKLGRYNAVNSCLSYAGTPSLQTISLFGFAKEAGLVSSLREEILKEPTLRHLNIQILDQLPNMAPGGGETVVLLTSHEDFDTVIYVDTDQNRRLELNALLHQRLKGNDNVTIERFSLVKQGGAFDGNFEKFGFSLWFGNPSKVSPNFCQIENRGPPTGEVALISSILACLRLSAMPQTKLSIAAGTIP